MLLRPEAVGLLTLVHEAFRTGNDESHARLSAWVEDLDPEALRDVVETLLILAYYATTTPDIDPEPWLRHVGIAAAVPR